MPVKFSCVGVLCILSFQTIQETTGGFTFFYPVDLSWEQMRFFFLPALNRPLLWEELSFCTYPVHH